MKIATNKFYKGILLIFIIIMLSTLNGCGDMTSYTPPEKPVLYHKDIEVRVVSNKKQKFTGKVPRASQNIKVVSEEYNLENSFNYSSSGVFMNMPFWSVKEGDVIQAELLSWKLESTGEIVKREINRLIK